MMISTDDEKTNVINDNNNNVDVEKSSRINANIGDIYVSASIELPFSASVAFDAFKDPTRQPSWSSWLQSVEYVDRVNTPDLTKWTISVMRFKFSWNAKNTKLDRQNGIIEWESSSGVKNFGRVQFTPNNDTDSSSTMCLSMTVATPRIIQRLLGGKRKALQNLIQEKMLRQTLESFREVVLRVDVPMLNER